MNDLEDRLRDAYRSAADTITPQSVPEPRLETQGPVRQRAHASRMRLFAPVAAAAGVAAVILAATTLTAQSPAPHDHQSPASHRHSRTTASGAFPPFTVASGGSELQVYRTGTSQVVSTLTPPNGLQFANVASGGTTGDFLVAAQASIDSATGCQAAFYRFQLAADGKASPLKLVRWVHGSLPTAIAASPGGRTIAYAAVRCAGGNSTGTLPSSAPIGIIGVMGAGLNRTWSFNLGQDYPSYLAVSANGKTVAFPMYTGFSANPAQSLYLLHTDSSAADVTEASTILHALHPDSATISPDGSRIYVSAGGTIRSYRLNGKPIGVLQHSGKCGISLDETGRYMLAQCGESISGLNLKTGKTIQLPFSTTIDQAGNAVAW